MFLLSWLNFCKYQLPKWICSSTGQFSTTGAKIGKEFFGTKDASVKLIYGDVVDYRVNLNYCPSCLKRLRTVLLNILCWIVTKIVGKCKHKWKKTCPCLSNIFSLKLFRKAVPPLRDVWLFLKILFKQTI